MYKRELFFIATFAFLWLVIVNRKRSLKWGCFVATLEIDPKKRLVLALDDIKTLEEAGQIVELLSDEIEYFKLGYELQQRLINAAYFIQDDERAHKDVDVGRKFIKPLKGRIVWDIKYNDVEKTVGLAVQALCESGFIKMFTVHASSGISSVRAAVKNSCFSSLSGEGDETKVHDRPFVLGVTLLTSFKELGTNNTFNRSIKSQIWQMASQAKLAGVDGLVGPGKEVQFLREQEEFRDMIFAVTGVRPETFPTTFDDHVNPIMVGDAIRAGAEYLIMGRPILHAMGTKPLMAVRKIKEEILKASV